MPRSPIHRTLMPALAALALGTAACSSDTASSAGDDGPASTTVTAGITDTSLTLAPSSTEPGEITFAVSNTGTQIHEIEIFKGDVAHDAMPVENNVANTEGLELIDEIEDIAPGTRADLTAHLDAGNYVIVCNLPGHYASGLHTGFTVS